MTHVATGLALRYGSCFWRKGHYWDKHTRQLIEPYERTALAMGLLIGSGIVDGVTATFLFALGILSLVGALSLSAGVCFAVGSFISISAILALVITHYRPLKAPQER